MSVDDSAASAGKPDAKEEDDIMEGDIVIVSALGKDAAGGHHLMKSSNVRDGDVMIGSRCCYTTRTRFRFPRFRIRRSTRRRSDARWW